MSPCCQRSEAKWPHFMVWLALVGEPEPDDDDRGRYLGVPGADRGPALFQRGDQAGAAVGFSPVSVVWPEPFDTYVSRVIDVAVVMRGHRRSSRCGERGRVGGVYRVDARS